jgi:hypothetical protein
VVEHDRGTEAAQHGPGGCALAEHEVQEQQAERIEHRHDGDGEERRVRAIASGRLAVASDPVAGEREHE